ncbi:DUF11 domain-containing protein [Ammoniphilus sp. CFH 90114]|uniref:DUF11 domain-containing protein n=1 Tax=Ammoniphilus sp. CFH 90114 TaxID=2493665 RepID=UPI00100E45CF|nr:DUF11 domain-containing protein [Ammoniphilus sp. CFH 90114]RXT00130.1 DUF11 domain-containing protein [Ammoniphilus sp. CFH 90114]
MIGLGILIADLLVTKEASPSQVSPGDTITYSVRLTNLGPNTATGVKLTDVLPAELGLVEFSSSFGTCVFTNNVITCDIGTMTPSGNVLLTISARVDEDTPSGTFIDNVAVATSNQFDPDFQNNVVRLSTLVTSDD